VLVRAGRRKESVDGCATGDEMVAPPVWSAMRCVTVTIAAAKPRYSDGSHLRELG